MTEEILVNVLLLSFWKFGVSGFVEWRKGWESMVRGWKMRKGKVIAVRPEDLEERLRSGRVKIPSRD